MDFFRGLCLFHQLFLFCFWEFGEHLMDCQLIGDSVVSDGEANLLVAFFSPSLLVASFSRPRAGVLSVSPVVPPAVIFAIAVVVAVPAAVVVGI